VIAIIVLAIILFVLFFYSAFLVKARTDSGRVDEPFSLSITMAQSNTILPVSSPLSPIKVKKIKMIITGYSSDPWQTDDTPFITASGSMVQDGVVANNLLPFGTKIRIPVLYGDKIFVVEDRMNAGKSHYHLDIWFPDRQKAKNFGVKEAVVEILGN